MEKTMNERIKQLAVEAGIISAEYNGFDSTGLTISQRKFAELIVKECANHCDLLLDHKISSEWSRGTHDCSRAIKKHFGVVNND
jgi:hypothetical protein